MTGRRVTAEQVAVMRSLRESGHTAWQVGEALGLSDSTVRNYWNGRPCVDCGTPVCASNLASPKRCEPCSMAHQRAELLIWSREAAIQAAHAWEREHGRPPRARDWHHASDEHPDSSQVYGAGKIGRRYGWATWNDFLRDAGMSFWARGEHGRAPRRTVAA